MFHITTNYFPRFWQMYESKIGTQKNTSLGLTRRPNIYIFLKVTAFDSGRKSLRLLITINIINIKLLIIKTIQQSYIVDNFFV